MCPAYLMHLFPSPIIYYLTFVPTYALSDFILSIFIIGNSLKTGMKSNDRNIRM